MYKLDGQRFGRLSVIERCPSSGGAGQQLKWLCQCDCGNMTTVLSYLLRMGSTRSCGCLVLEHAKTMSKTKHGQWQSRTYHTWEGMKQRCLNPNATRYPTYGGVGIIVCESWLFFENFYADMGDRPEGKTLDRINPFGNYEPTNCRWATPKEQSNNQRRHQLSEEVTPLC